MSEFERLVLRALYYILYHTLFQDRNKYDAESLLDTLQEAFRK